MDNHLLVSCAHLPYVKHLLLRQVVKAVILRGACSIDAVVRFWARTSFSEPTDWWIGYALLINGCRIFCQDGEHRHRGTSLRRDGTGSQWVKRVLLLIAVSVAQFSQNAPERTVPPGPDYGQARGVHCRWASGSPDGSPPVCVFGALQELGACCGLWVLLGLLHTCWCSLRTSALPGHQSPGVSALRGRAPAGGSGRPVPDPGMLSTDVPSIPAALCLQVRQGVGTAHRCVHPSWGGWPFRACLYCDAWMRPILWVLWRLRLEFACKSPFCMWAPDIICSLQQQYLVILFHRLGRFRLNALP